MELTRIQEIASGDRDFERELIEIFIASARNHLRALDSALRKRDFSLVEQEAHSLKGASANIGAERMKEIALEIEEVGSTGDLKPALEAFERLKSEFSRVCRCLQDYLKPKDS